MDYVPKKIGTKPNTEREYYLFALKVIGDFGVSIAVPVVAFALIGKYLDGRYDTKPLFLIIGFIISTIISAIHVYKKAKKYDQEYKEINNHEKLQK